MQLLLEKAAAMIAPVSASRATTCAPTIPVTDKPVEVVHVAGNGGLECLRLTQEETCCGGLNGHYNIWPRWLGPGKRVTAAGDVDRDKR